MNVKVFGDDEDESDSAISNRYEDMKHKMEKFDSAKAQLEAEQMIEISAGESRFENMEWRFGIKRYKLIDLKKETETTKALVVVAGASNNNETEAGTFSGAAPCTDVVTRNTEPINQKYEINPLRQFQIPKKAPLFSPLPQRFRGSKKLSDLDESMTPSKKAKLSESFVKLEINETALCPYCGIMFPAEKIEKHTQICWPEEH